MNVTNPLSFACWLVIAAVPPLLAGVAHDETQALKEMLRQADGRTVTLRAGHTYHLTEKIELQSLCPNGIRIDGNGATLKAADGFKHGVLLTATVLLAGNPYTPGVVIRDLSVDGDGKVGRPVFGRWKHARIHNLTVQGGTDYQVNAVWENSTITRLDVIGNQQQTNNGFDCNLTESYLYDVRVDMHGNLKESAFWLNGCRSAAVMKLSLKDGRTAFGLENCEDVQVVGLVARGRFSFRVVNILPARASARIHLYDVDLVTTHVGGDPATGIHFNATKGGLVVQGRIASSGPGVLLTHGASDIDVWDVKLPSQAVRPQHAWTTSRQHHHFSSKTRTPGGAAHNRAPFVWAGPDRAVRSTESVRLKAIVADETPVRRLSTAWSKKAGPGHVAFGDVRSPTSIATFERPGLYQLRFTATDGEKTSHDDFQLKVGLPRGRMVRGQVGR